MSTKSTSYRIPDLSDENFLNAVCGLRPCRSTGIRIEHEKVGSKHIIHNYGHGGCGITLSFGSASIASDLVDQLEPSGPPPHIGVLGSGVIGLSTAIELRKRNYKVTVYADKIGNETTSTLAGALWLPVGVELGVLECNVLRDQQILQKSRDAFQSLDRNRFAIESVDVFEPENTTTTPGIFEETMNGVIAPPIDIDSFPFSSPINPGRMFTTDFIHTQIFLNELISELRSLGGEIVKQHFDNQDRIQSLDQSILVNSLALGSRTLFDDDLVYPARGVLVHMKPQDLGYCVHDGYKYMFPRENALVLGGCFQENEWNEIPDEHMIQEILNHHRRFFGII